MWFGLVRKRFVCAVVFELKYFLIKIRKLLFTAFSVADRITFYSFGMLLRAKKEKSSNKIIFIAEFTADEIKKKSISNFFYDATFNAV